MVAAAPVKRRLSIVLPAYDEVANIGVAIDRATAMAERLFAEHEIIVVDDGSCDGTGRVVSAIAERDSRVRLVRHDHNRGYGEALRSGFRAARLDLVFFTDADNQFDLEEIERFLPWIDRVDVVAGYRRRRMDPPMRRLAAFGWNQLVRAAFYVPVRDIDCAFKLFRRSVFDSLDLESVGAMVNTELMVKLGRSGAGVVEIPVTHFPRTAGKPRGAHPRVIARAARELVSMQRRLRAATPPPPAPSGVDVVKAPSPVPREMVIGGGIAGCAAALRLARAGHQVTLVERSPQLGGLVVSFSVSGTPLECFYHHIFPHELDMVGLIQELGLDQSLQWHDSSTGVLHDGRIWPFTSPLDLLRFAPLSLPDRVLAGVGALRMRRVREWKPLDTVSAQQWLRSYCGEGASRVLWDPLLRAKFGTAADQVPAAWMWGRINQRSAARRGMGEKLGYLRGGFKQLFDGLHRELVRLGVDVRTSTEVRRVEVVDGRVSAVETSNGIDEVDAVLYAGTLNGLERLVPAEHHDPRWGRIGCLGVLCVVLELRKSVSDIYWTNVCDSRLPFGGIIEHTNLLPASDYGDRVVVYLSRYFTMDEPIASVDPGEEAERWVDLLVDHVDHLSHDDVLAVHPFRSAYAAPLMSLGHLERIPPVHSPVKGLYITTTAQIYPQDRGMDEGIKAGYRAAEVLINDAAAVVHA
jgi:protoporphyrinogen oxidase